MEAHTGHGPARPCFWWNALRFTAYGTRFPQGATQSFPVDKSGYQDMFIRDDRHKSCCNNFNKVVAVADLLGYFLAGVKREL